MKYLYLLLFALPPTLIFSQQSPMTTRSDNRTDYVMTGPHDQTRSVTTVMQSNTTLPLEEGETYHYYYEIHGDSIKTFQPVGAVNHDSDAVSAFIVQFQSPPMARLMTKGRPIPDKHADDMDRIEQEHAWFRSDLEKIEALKGGLLSTDSGSQSTVIRYEYKTALNGVSIKTRQEIIDEIRSLPYVKRVDESRRVYALVDEAATVVGADQVWANHGATGKGIVIGIIDSGIDYMHPDLGGGIGKGFKVIGGYDFVNNDSDPMDDNGHGTHVAGIAAANGLIKGIAPDAKLMAYKVLGMSGHGPSCGIIAAIDQSVIDGVDVINLSLGDEGSSANDPMSVAANNASAAGVVVVAAAGNSGPDYQTISSPADAPRVISVGVTFKNDQIEEWGSKGPTNVYYEVKPDLVAPGVAINSTMPNGGYAHQTGTSMAAPVVAGAAALLLEQNPELNPAEIKSIFLQTAADLGYDIWTQGAGRLDISAAFNMPDLLINPPILSFGLIDNEINSWSRTRSLTIINSSLDQQNVQVELPENIPSGLTIKYEPSHLVLSPGQKLEIKVSVIVDNQLLPYPNNFPGTYKHKISIHTGTRTYKVPIVFLKTNLLILEFDETPLNLLIGNKKQADRLFCGPDKRMEILIENDIYYLIGRYGDLKTRVFREDIEFPETSYVKIKKSEANNHIRRKALNKDGVNVKLNYYVEHLIRQYPNGWNDGKTIISCPNYISDKYFSNFSDYFKWYWYGTNTSVDNITNYVFGGQLIGCQSGANQIYDPKDLKHIQFMHNRNFGVESAFALTNFGSSYLRDLTIRDQHVYAQLNPSSLTFPFKQDYYASPGYKKEPFSKGFYVQYFKKTKESSPFLRDNLFASSPLLSFNENDELIITPWIEADDAYCDTFGGGVFLLGLNPPGWYGNIIQRGSHLSFFNKSAPPFDHLFLWQMKDKNPRTSLNYRWYQNGILFKMGDLFKDFNIFWNEATSREGFQPGQSHRFEIDFDDFVVHGRQGLATARLEWKEKMNPPRMTSFYILADGRHTDIIKEGEHPVIRFGALENTTEGSSLTRVALYLREDSDSEWNELNLQKQERVFETELIDELPQGFISLKIEAADESGSRMTYVVEPAFLNYPASGVATTRVKDIDYTTAISGGIIFLDKPGQTSSRGVVWCTSPEPTIGSRTGITTDGSGPGEFTSTLSDLEPGTAYYVRAYAIGNNETSYGKQRHFITPQEVIIFRVDAVPNNDLFGIADGSAEYEKGEEVTLVAMPAKGYHFLNWTENGTVVSEDKTYTFIAENNRQITANFAINTYQLTYMAGENGEIIGLSAQTVEHGQDGSEVMAFADEGFHFVQWCDGSIDNPRSDYIVTENVNVTAMFAINVYTTDVSVNRDDYGNVEGAGVYEHGMQVTLVAMPAEGYHFLNWTENGTVVSEDKTYTFIAENNRQLTANFAINIYQLTYMAGENGEIIGLSAQTVEHGQDGSEVMAFADEGFHFVQWCDGSIDNPRSDHAVTNNIHVTAMFAINVYTIQARANNDSYGYITGEGDYEHGQTTTLIATSSDTENFIFINWTENNLEVHDQAVYSFTAISNRNLLANFQNVTSAETTLNQYSHVKAFPIPASSKLTIVSDDIILEVRIIDLLGQQWLTEGVAKQSVELNVSALKNGLYFLQLRTHDGLRVLKVQIAR